MGKVLSYLLVLLVVLGGSGFLLAKSADASTPVDPLYKIDLLAESVQRTFTFNEVKIAELEQDILDERALELETLLEDETDEEILGEAVEQLDRQRERAQERVQLLMDEDSNYDEAELARIQSRLETQLQNQLQNMEKVQVKFQEKSSENEQIQENYQKAVESVDKAQQNFQEAVKKMNNEKSKGNTEQNVNDDAGDGIKNKESNSNR